MSLLCLILPVSWVFFFARSYTYIGGLKYPRVQN